MKIIITEEQSKKLFIPRKLSKDDSRYDEWNNKQPIIEGKRINQYSPVGEKDGVWLFYYDSGQLHVKGSYIKGIRDGMWEWYEEDGKLSIKGLLVDGAKEGMWEYYHTNGKLKSKRFYKGGLSEGIALYYWQNGNLKSNGICKNDRRDGIWEFYDSDGDPLGREVYDKGIWVKNLPPIESLEH
jgi:antitoxin component YwqK of YwqJK toxin-antitoxin module